VRVLSIGDRAEECPRALTRQPLAFQCHAMNRRNGMRLRLRDHLERIPVERDADQYIRTAQIGEQRDRLRNFSRYALSGSLISGFCERTTLSIAADRQGKTKRMVEVRASTTVLPVANKAKPRH